MTDLSKTETLANDWLNETLALIQKDPAAAKLAIDAMEDLTGKVKPVLELKIGSDACDTVSSPPETVDHGDGNAPSTQGAQSESHGLTRNQLSKVRGVYLMDALTQGDTHHTLASIVSALKAHDFRTDDGSELTEAAVRSHLHRLKMAGYVAMISSGVYQLTPDGFEYLQQQRVGQKPLLDKFSAAVRAA